MALSAPSLFLYGLQITELNRSLDFKADSMGPQLNATLTIGYYSLSSLADEIITQMQLADPTNDYSVTIDRTLSGGTQNRITISTDGTFLSLLFGTGTRAASTVATLIGFLAADYTGDTSYDGSSSAGTPLVTNLAAYNFLPIEMNQKHFGSLNISSSGKKEAIVFATQVFWQAQFQYIPKTTVIDEWVPLMQWLTYQRRFEFTPEITDPSVFYEGTLEKTGEDGKGLAYKFKEMLPKFPNEYDTGLLTFRQSGG